jgi:hypothetical protein
MGKMKEEFMEMRMNEQDQTINTMHEIAAGYNQSTNQLNNKIMKKEPKKEAVVETRVEVLRRLYKENGLTAEDVHKSNLGFAIITRTGIDKIVSNNGITIGYEVVAMDLKHEDETVVVKAAGTMKGADGVVKNMMSFGEVNITNYPVKKSRKDVTIPRYPVAMAEKRAMSRVVLKLTGFYEQGVFGQDEIVDEPEK